MTEQALGFIPGGILSAAWGYGQTNRSFYQVSRVSGQWAWVREVKGKVVGTQGCDDMKIPLPGEFQEGSKPIKRKIHKNPHGDFIKIEKWGIYASAWSGKPERETGAMYGH